MKVALFVLTVGICTGCTTGYWVDRGRDAADIVTASVGVGGGANARVGPVGVGILYFKDQYGIRGGCLGNLRGSSESGWFIGPGLEKFNLKEARARNKSYCSAIWFMNDGKPPVKRDGWPIGTGPRRHSSSSANVSLGNIGCIEPDPRGLAVVAAVIVAVCSVSLPMDLDYYPNRKYLHNHRPYYTQLETTIGVGGGMRLGVNLGECVDFLLGFVGKDIFGDDLEKNRQVL